MSSRKKQIWLQPHEVRVVLACIDYALSEIERELNRGSTPVEKMTLRYTRGEIQTVKPLFAPGTES